MKNSLFTAFACTLVLLTTAAPCQQPGDPGNGGRTTINLNGTWQFDQTLTVSIAEKLSGKVLITRSGRFATKRDNLSEAVIDIQMPDFTAKNGTPVISRRYLKVGEQVEYQFYMMVAGGGWE